MTPQDRVLIEGRKVRLRDWQLKDVEAFREWQKPGHLWQSLDGPYYHSNIDESAKLASELTARIEKQEFPNPRGRLVLADTETDAIFGTVSSYWESKETFWLCIGITIVDETRWGKGIGYEAMGLWVDYLFARHPEIVRLDMRTWSGNEGLIRLAKKLGFVQEACFRKARIVDGKYYDGLGFGILRTEWGELHPKGFPCR